MATPFPLLRLPRLALIDVFQHMKHIEVIAFSLLSERTYNLSKYLYKTRSSRYIALRIEDNYLTMRVTLPDWSPLTLYFHTNVSKTVEVFYQHKPVQWKNVGLSTKQWIERIFNVSKCPSLSKLTLNGAPGDNVFSVLDVIPKVTKLKIWVNCSNTLAKRAVEVLAPVTSSIRFFKVPFSNREEFLKFWMSNVDCLSIYNDHLSRFQFNLNDLLASNAVKLELDEVPLSLRDLNRFFFNWMNKTSNHMLKNLSLKSLEEINRDILVEGLDATHFKIVFTGGIYVKRIDGKLAAITFRNSFEGTFINFDVRP